MRLKINLGGWKHLRDKGIIDVRSVEICSNNQVGEYWWKVNKGQQKYLESELEWRKKRDYFWSLYCRYNLTLIWWCGIFIIIQNGYFSFIFPTSMSVHEDDIKR